MTNTQLLKAALKKGLTLCFMDIETSPSLAYTYPLRECYIAHDQIINHGQITSIGWLYEHDKLLHLKGWDDSHKEDGEFDLLRPDRDRDLLIDALEALSGADIIVGQNGDSFDIKIIQWRLNDLALPPLKNLVSLDTLKLSRKVFRPPSHKLDFRSKAYKFGGKIKQDMQDCMDVAMGDEKKQRNRIKYNGKDVLDLRRIFWRELEAYVLPAAIVNLLKNFIGGAKPRCEQCAKKHLSRFNVAKRKVGDIIVYVCKNCDHRWRVV